MVLFNAHWSKINTIYFVVRSALDSFLTFDNKKTFLLCSLNRFIFVPLYPNNNKVINMGYRFIKIFSVFCTFLFVTIAACGQTTRHEIKAGETLYSISHTYGVTIQAIHNELIKDSRFVLIGRGIYALDKWGFKKGTVSETITDILKQSKKPLTREQIVKKVLSTRKVKETTILLNLQNKKLFKKIDKNSYTIAE